VTTSTRIAVTAASTDLRNLVNAMVVAFLVTAGVTGLQSTLPWPGTPTEFTVLAAVIAALALVAAVFFRTRGHILHGGADSWIGLIFLLTGIHFALRLALAAIHLPAEQLVPIVTTSWVATQLGSALILLVFVGGRMGATSARAVLIIGIALAVAAGIFGLALMMKRTALASGINTTNAALAATFLVATTLTLIQAFRERHVRTIWLGAAFIIITAANTDLTWSHAAFDSAFMWGHVLLLTGLTVPLVAAVAESLSLLSSQARLNRRVRRLGQRVEALLDSLPVAVLTLDGEANLKYANRRANALMGVPPGVSSGPSGPIWARGMEPEDGLRLAEVVSRLARHELDHHSTELPLTAPDGTAHWLSVELRPIHDPVEDQPRVLLAGSEITALVVAQRTAERRHERLSVLTNLAQGLGAETSEEGILAHLFTLAREQFGVAAAAILRPEPDQTRLHVGRSIGVSEEVRRALAGAWLTQTALRVFHDGFPNVAEVEPTGIVSLGPGRIALAPLLAAGRSIGVLGMAGGQWNVTSPEDLDVLLQIGALVGGALHLGDVLEELEEQRSIALEASRLKSEFLANTSHELRTPLSSILGFLKLILDGHVEDPEKQLSYLRIAHDSATRLLGIINDVLDLAKIEAGRLETRPQPTPVAPILEDLDALFRHQARDKGVELGIPTVEKSLEIFADPDRTRQILTNLLSNAVKFTPSSGSIDIEVGAAEDTVTFTVRDTGAGIPSDELERVFDSFHQVDGSTTRTTGGTGLGLTISRRLAERMGGSVTLSSAGVGHGTTARLVLPRRPQDRR